MKFLKADLDPNINEFSASIINNLLYLATLSDLHGAPVLICFVPVPTAKSAIEESSVSPDL